MAPVLTSIFDEHRRLLFGVAYRMTGSVADAEDLVQDAWLRWSTVDVDGVDNPKAYLIRIITNLSLKQLTSARARREAYVGPWLPEPLLTEPDASQDAEMTESISQAMLVVLETLSPLERAVFLLHDVFGYRHGEISSILDRSEDAVRQTAIRARAHVAARRPRYTTDPGVRHKAAERFLAAAAGGDLNSMMELLAPDVVAWADGGGKVTAAQRPLVGADHVARWLLGFLRKPSVAGVRLEVREINGETGLLGLAGDTPIGTIGFDLADGRITGIRFVANPDKLRGLR